MFFLTIFTPFLCQSWPRPDNGNIIQPFFHALILSHHEAKKLRLYMRLSQILEAQCVNMRPHWDSRQQRQSSLKDNWGKLPCFCHNQFNNILFSSTANTFTIDIVKDVINPVCTRWVCQTLVRKWHLPLPFSSTYLAHSVTTSFATSLKIPSPSAWANKRCTRPLVRCIREVFMIKFEIPYWSSLRPVDTSSEIRIQNRPGLSALKLWELEGLFAIIYGIKFQNQSGSKPR